MNGQPSRQRLYCRSLAWPCITEKRERWSLGQLILTDQNAHVHTYIHTYFFDIHIYINADIHPHTHTHAHIHTDSFRPLLTSPKSALMVAATQAPEKCTSRKRQLSRIERALNPEPETKTKPKAATLNPKP